MEHGIQIAWNTVVKMTDGLFALLPNLLIAALVFLLFYTASRFAGNMISSIAGRANLDRTLCHAIGKLAAVFTNVFGVLVCAVILVPTFSPDKLIAGLGITSVAIGFAFQNILQNFFAGILILWQKPFGIGDEIKSKDFEGVVEDITIRSTILHTYTGERVFIPNGILLTDPVVVNTAFASRRIHVQLPISDLDPEKALSIARSALSGVGAISKDPAPEIYVSVAGGVPVLDIYFWAASKNTQIIRATNESTYAVQQALVKNSLPKKVA